VNVDSNQNIEIPSRYRSFRLLEDEDNSVTDTDRVRRNGSESLERQASIIRSPWGVEQRLRLTNEKIIASLEQQFIT
ncbi:hypothetical protein DAPPUDRAFT_337190, partial [Daphnia pulex]